MLNREEHTIEHIGESISEPQGHPVTKSPDILAPISFLALNTTSSSVT